MTLAPEIVPPAIDICRAAIDGHRGGKTGCADFFEPAGKYFRSGSYPAVISRLYATGGDQSVDRRAVNELDTALQRCSNRHAATSDGCKATIGGDVIGDDPATEHLEAAGRDKNITTGNLARGNVYCGIYDRHLYLLLLLYSSSMQSASFRNFIIFPASSAIGEVMHVQHSLAVTACGHQQI